MRPLPPSAKRCNWRFGRSHWTSPGDDAGMQSFEELLLRPLRATPWRIIWREFAYCRLARPERREEQRAWGRSRCAALWSGIGNENGSQTNFHAASRYARHALRRASSGCATRFFAARILHNATSRFTLPPAEPLARASATAGTPEAAAGRPRGSIRRSWRALAISVRPPILRCRPPRSAAPSPANRRGP